MTELLKKAFDEASRLRDQEQNAIAQWLLEEIASERQWDDAFDRSQQVLEKLATEAMDEHRHGRSQPLDPDQL